MEVVEEVIHFHDTYLLLNDIHEIIDNEIVVNSIPPQTWVNYLAMLLNQTRDSSRMSYEDSKKRVFPCIYPPQILMVCIGRRLVLQTEIL